MRSEVREEEGRGGGGGRSGWEEMLGRRWGVEEGKKAFLIQVSYDIYLFSAILPSQNT